ncbi:hypothetical protein EXN66_Car000302 [Channa argus]|uniref:Uncharacterized protein n=1 Tax=Channa argus TaxID=215402 RepID=A0A6G1QXT1_CHAAH|nr:hypothetical protein EXN66_Car000302 [Channa argus]
MFITTSIATVVINRLLLKNTFGAIIKMRELYNVEKKKIQWSSLVFTIEVLSLAVKSIFAVLFNLWI